MNEVFADTSGWANYFVRTEPFHQDAKGLMQQWYKDQTRVITTNYILSELVALFISPLRIPRPKQIQAIETIKAVDWIEIIHIDRKGYHLTMDRIPAWVCTQCGEAYFDEAEVEAIQEALGALDQQSEKLAASG